MVNKAKEDWDMDTSTRTGNYSYQLKNSVY